MNAMTMSVLHEGVLDTRVLIDNVQEQTLEFARYLHTAEPEAVLNRGMLAEVPEVLHELDPDTPLNLSNLASELGDMQWYIARKADQHGISLSTICGPDAFTVDEFQRRCVAAPKISRIYAPDGSIIFPWSRGDVALSVLAFRVVDAETRSDDRLWHGHENGIPLEQTLRDLYTFIAVTAGTYGLQLSDLHKQNIHKLKTRDRDAHVIDDEKVAKIEPLEDIRSKLEKKRFALGASAVHLYSLDELLAAA